MIAYGASILLLMLTGPVVAQTVGPQIVDATTLHSKIMCGYQGWFRCPGDAAGMGWVHWSRETGRIAPETLTFEMWPDVSELGPDERFAAPGFTHPDGSQAELFSSDHPATVLRHFEWMRDYGIDGAWLQRFAVGLLGGPLEGQYDTFLSVLEHVRAAASATGRAWAISYDIAAMPEADIYEVVTNDWRRLVESGIVADERYVHEGGLPVVQLWGLYPGNERNRITAETSHRLADFFAEPGPNAAYFVGGGAWAWRDTDDPLWQSLYARLDACCPWNVGNYSLSADGVASASTHYWRDDQEACERNGVFWIPVIYPGFSWDNLTQQEPGSSIIARRGGEFLWEQLHELAVMGVDTVYVAMFDEVDEGTAVFKVTSSPPVEGHFVGYEDLPSDWYLKLPREGVAMLRGQRPISEAIPVAP